jgi:hypothetical protein
MLQPGHSSRMLCDPQAKTNEREPFVSRMSFLYQRQLLSRQFHDSAHDAIILGHSIFPTLMDNILLWLILKLNIKMSI